MLLESLVVSREARKSYGTKSVHQVRRRNRTTVRPHLAMDFRGLDCQNRSTSERDLS